MGGGRELSVWHNPAYAVLSHPSRLALVCPGRNRFGLLSGTSPNGALRDKHFDGGNRDLPRVLYGRNIPGPKGGTAANGRWSGIALIGAYLLAIGVGALIGALGGFLLTRKLLAHR
jgi:hypothetical protein